MHAWRRQYDDVQLTDEMKKRYPDWESWVTDGKMKPRPKYTPEMD